MPKCVIIFLTILSLSFCNFYAYPHAFSVVSPDENVSYSEGLSDYKKDYAIRGGTKVLKDSEKDKKLQFFICGVILVTFIIAIVIYTSNRSKRR